MTTAFFAPAYGVGFVEWQDAIPDLLDRWDEYNHVGDVPDDSSCLRATMDETVRQPETVATVDPVENSRRKKPKKVPKDTAKVAPEGDKPKPCFPFMAGNCPHDGKTCEYSHKASVVAK